MYITWVDDHVRGVQVKETLPWKRPWPPSINTSEGVTVHSVTQAKGPRGPIATCKPSILILIPGAQVPDAVEPSTVPPKNQV